MWDRVRRYLVATSTVLVLVSARRHRVHSAVAGSSIFIPTAALTNISALGVTTGETPAYVVTPSGLFRSADPTYGRWEQMNQVTGSTVISPNPQVSNDLVYSTANGIFRGLDGGRTARRVSSCVLTGLARARSAPEVLYGITIGGKDGCPFNADVYWSRASFLSSSARLLGSPISPPTVCHGSPCQYFEKGALVKGNTPVPLVADLLAASSAASVPVGGSTSTITYADLAKLESRRTPPPTGFQHGVLVGPTGTFVPFSAQLAAKPGYVVPSFFWCFLTDSPAVPAGWLHDIGLPLTPAVPATVTKGALGKRAITIQAFHPHR